MNLRSFILVTAVIGIAISCLTFPRLWSLSILSATFAFTSSCFLISCFHSNNSTRNFAIGFVATALSLYILEANSPYTASEYLALLYENYEAETMEQAVTKNGGLNWGKIDTPIAQRAYPLRCLIACISGLIGGVCAQLILRNEAPRP